MTLCIEKCALISCLAFYSIVPSIQNNSSKNCESKKKKNVNAVNCSNCLKIVIKMKKSWLFGQNVVIANAILRYDQVTPRKKSYIVQKVISDSRKFKENRFRVSMLDVHQGICC